MLAFAEVPLLVTTIGKFDPTARLLTAILAMMVVLPRALFSAASAAVVGACYVDRPCAKSENYPESYYIANMAAAAAWAIQVSALGVLMCDVFATPFAFSVSRLIVGNHHVLSLAIYLAVTASAFPRVIRTAMGIVGIDYKKIE
jgi:ABC-type spermidine/putrescine transport system permease subunit I